MNAYISVVVRDYSQTVPHIEAKQNSANPKIWAVRFGTIDLVAWADADGTVETLDELIDALTEMRNGVAGHREPVDA